MVKPRGDWRRFGHSTDQTFAQHAIEVHICCGCMQWHEGKKPDACRQCGRMDFWDFPSKGEALWWPRLLQRQERGEIADLERQVRIRLIACRQDDGKPVDSGVVYIADFRWRDVKTGERVTAEVKPGGRMTYESQIKIRWAESMGIRITMLDRPSNSNR